jgi:glycosyltransferase involved in cell wall biosynthesis
MRILHLSTYDSGGGAAKAAYRLHHSLLNLGEDSLMLVQQRHTNEAEIHRVPAGLPRIAMMLSQRIEVWQQAGKPVLDLAWWSNGLAQHINALEPDIVNLHWVSRGFLSIPSLSHIHAPLVWTMHDMASFTGGCHYSGGCEHYQQACGNCPLLPSPYEHDLSRQTWERKQAWRALKIQLVSPSHWLAECAQKSTLFAQMPIQVIHNGIDLQLFQPKNSNIREKLGVSSDKRLILFGAFNSIDDKRKGIDYLLAALPKLGDINVACIIFGSDAPENPPALGLPLYYTGYVESEAAMAELYASADVFIAPSLEDNLPNTVAEALACGTPVVAFNATGMPDMISHQMNGYLAQAYDSDDLAAGIQWVLQDTERIAQLSTSARQTALEKFDERNAVQAYLKLYQHCLRTSTQFRA